MEFAGIVPGSPSSFTVTASASVSPRFAKLPVARPKLNSRVKMSQVVSRVPGMCAMLRCYRRAKSSANHGDCPLHVPFRHVECAVREKDYRAGIGRCLVKVESEIRVAEFL